MEGRDGREDRGRGKEGGKLGEMDQRGKKMFRCDTLAPFWPMPHLCTLLMLLTDFSIRFPPWHSTHSPSHLLPRPTPHPCPFARSPALFLPRQAHLEQPALQNPMQQITGSNRQKAPEFQAVLEAHQGPLCADKPRHRRAGGFPLNAFLLFVWASMMRRIRIRIRFTCPSSFIQQS
jgi:hypothetical protein